MTEKNNKASKAGLIVGGCSTVGLGLGLFFFPQGVFGFTSLFAFIGCIVLGTGIGLLISGFLKD